MTSMHPQRIAIARETTNTMTWEKATTAAKAGADTDRARHDVAAAQRVTQKKTAELAVATAGAQQNKVLSGEDGVVKER